MSDIDSDVQSTASDMSTDGPNIPRNKGGRPRKVKRGHGPGRGHKKLRKQNDSVNSSRHANFQLMPDHWIWQLTICDGGWKPWVSMNQT